MQELKVILTWEAIYDVTDIEDQLERLENVGIMLGKTDLLYRGYPIYKKVFSPSIIFYIVKEPRKGNSCTQGASRGA